MTTQLHALSFAAQDPPALARFWAAVLHREVADDGTTLLPDGDPGFCIRFRPTDEPKTRPNQVHFDLTSRTDDDQRAIIARVLELGGRHLDIGQGADADHVVMADPEGNELCVIESWNGFLAGTAAIGALSSDGSEAVGRFWSEALGWPLVWDQDEETAIQSPQGGSKISWGGPPFNEKVGVNRLQLELSADDVPTEVARLVSLGATVVTTADVVEMLDPDGNEFRVQPL